MNQVHHKIHRPKIYLSITTSEPGANLQMDFLIYWDHPFQYILSVVDVFLRKAAVRATTNHKGPTYTHFLKKMIEEDFEGKWPMDFNCD